MADIGTQVLAEGLAEGGAGGCAVSGSCDLLSAMALRAEEYRREAVAERSRAGSLAGVHRRNREKLEAARSELRELRRDCRESLDQRAEIARLTGLVEALGADPRKRSTIVSLREENATLKAKNAELEQALLEARAALAARDEELAALSGSGEAGGVASRIGDLQRRIATLEAIQSNQERHRFGDRSECRDKPRSPRRRGQQRGGAGHGRTPRPALPVREEVHDVAPDERRCRLCGKHLALNGAHVSELVEFEIKAHKRRIRRLRYRACGCAKEGPAEVSAPAVARLFANTSFGVSVWAQVLLEHYRFHRPFHQIARNFAEFGLRVSPGTLCGSLARFVPLFEPLSQEIRRHLVAAPVVQGDETVWRVQQQRREGGSRRCWLWVGLSDDAVWFHIDPTRSADAARRVFAGAAKGTILVVDRYSGYTPLFDGQGLVPGICWAHSRRDFVACEGAVENPWKAAWLERIAQVYQANRERLAHYRPDLDLLRQNADFRAAQQRLEARVDELFATAKQDLAGRDEDTDPRARPLRRLLKYRDGLTTFVTHPATPLDNNNSEQALRPPVIGRKLYFGNDSWTGAQLAGSLYSIFNTLERNGINVAHWLRAWLDACADNGGRPPDDLGPWLPWSMTPKRRDELRRPRPP